MKHSAFTSNIINNVETNSSPPIISVITVSFNAVKTIENTILSVVNRDWRNCEYIVIDGGSTDGTLEIIKRYQDKISYWSSEKDKGIYDAMNKGVKVANGQWINFMNAGDEFADGSHILFNKILNNSIGFDVLYGDVIIKKDKNSLDKAKSLHLLNYSLNFCHQSSFVRRDLLLENPFSLQYKISSDYNFFLNIFLNGSKFLYIECPVSIFEYGGISSGISKKYIKERLLIIFNSHKTIKNKIWFTYKFFKMLIPFNRNSINFFKK